MAVAEKLFGGCFETADQREAMTAFVEKRKPAPFENR
jgi:enoyl-CoA hydratase